MDRLAEHVGISGWELRKRNVIHPGEVWGPGQIMDDGCAGAEECLDRAKPHIDAALAAGKAVGVGLGLKNSGLGNGLREVCAAVVRFRSADGKVEVIYSNAAWNFDGSLRWMGAGPTSYSRYCCFATVADLDGDGAPEVIVNGQTAYRADGSLYWQRADLPVGYVAVANLDPEPEPEIINVAADWEGVRALESDGSPKWGPVALPQGGGGPPAIRSARTGVSCIG